MGTSGPDDLLNFRTFSGKFSTSTSSQFYVLSPVLS
jgi:hypothetical protein